MCCEFNMQYPLLSIIVPVYNTANYIPFTVESLLRQTYPNIEIILIDDGSIDNSPTLCDEFAEKHSCIKVVHKTNSGPADSRNVGLDMAKGELIGFVDSDDYIETDMYEKMYCEMQRSDSDIVFCDVIHEFRRQFRYPENFSTESMMFSKHDALSLLAKCQISSYFTNKLFKSSLFHTIRFPKGVIMLEDFALLHEIFYRANKVSYLAFSGYHYETNSSSLLRSANLKREWDLLYSVEERYQFFLNHKKEFPDLVQPSLDSLIDFTDGFFKHWLNHGAEATVLKDESKKCFIKKYTKSVLNGQYPIRKKIKWAMLNAGYIKLYVMLKNIYSYLFA